MTLDTMSEAELLEMRIGTFARNIRPNGRDTLSEEFGALLEQGRQEEYDHYRGIIGKLITLKSGSVASAYSEFRNYVDPDQYGKSKDQEKWLKLIEKRTGQTFDGDFDAAKAAMRKLAEKRRREAAASPAV